MSDFFARFSNVVSGLDETERTAVDGPPVARDKPDYGPAVKDGVVRYFSVSALQSADPETYAGCPRRWWWKYVAGKKEPERKSQKEGKILHAEAERYLRTGEDILGPVMRVGKKYMPAPGSDLLVEEPFSAMGSIEAAMKLRQELAEVSDPVRKVELAAEVVRLAGLTAAGVPLVGFIDVQHARGEYVDEVGALRREDLARGVVVENIDHKTTSKIHDTVERGEFKKGYAKSPGELASAVQMNGYAKYRLNRDSKIDHVRSTHVYYQTRGARDARLVTTLVSREHVEREWSRVESLGRELLDIAKVERASLVPAVSASCNSFREGCPHRDYCPPEGRTALVADLLGHGQRRQGAVSMSSIFDKVKKTDSAVTGQAQSDAGVSVVIPGATGGIFAKVSVAKTAEAADKANGASNGANGAAHKDVKSVEDDAARRREIDAEKERLKAEDDARAQAAATQVSTQAQNIAAVLPPDAPRPTMIEAARPLPPEVIAKIEDPEIRARAEAVARAHGAPVSGAADGDEATSASGGGRCPRGKERIALTQDQLAERKMTCECGKVLKLKPANEDGVYRATIPGHNILKPESKPEPEKTEKPIVNAAETTVVDATVTQRGPEVDEIIKKMADETPVVEKSETIEDPIGEAGEFMKRMNDGPKWTIYEGVYFTHGSPKALEDYYAPLLRLIESEYRLEDVRIAPKDSQLAYGGWRGALSVLVRTRPPEPGDYLVRSQGDFSAVVVEALAQMGARVCRGVSR